MNGDRFEIGDENFHCDNRNYETVETTDGLQVAVALDLCGTGFKGWYNDKIVSFSYDADFSFEVAEIIEKATSETYADQCREVKEHTKKKDYLYFLPEVAKRLQMTEGTLRRKPVDFQLAICKCYTDIWFCDDCTIRRILNAVLVGKPTTYKQTATET